MIVSLLDPNCTAAISTWSIDTWKESTTESVNLSALCQSTLWIEPEPSSTTTTSSLALHGGAGPGGGGGLGGSGGGAGGMGGPGLPLHVQDLTLPVPFVFASNWKLP
eukprot:CAMPEP_0174735456 /NCGR_PEP_ID=MMETSP1094-20130205/64987_1 /TAXON_ID=156173 /ORGANISM="Chrysochromulina brevifilum, Strain UTEX LB 985" /LENGTH=106 /DNA_ID=CAMNT_0015938421 /DNA_START=707 /DNA_END=1027 /DNA_ORIENTATION=-